MKKEIIKHILLPEHSKLSEKEVNSLLEKYNISKKQLPRIKLSDAGIKKLNLEAGNVVKIVRKSPTANETVFYRLVVEG